MSNSSAQVSRLANQITQIGEFVGYYYTLTLVGDGQLYNNNAVSFPHANNSSYCYTSTTKETTFQGSADFGTGLNCFIGISKNLSENYPGSSSPSMKMIDYGLLVNNQGEDPAVLYLIINGVIGSTATSSFTTPVITIEYNSDDGKLYFYDGNNELTGFTKTLGTTIDPYHLVLGSYYGGLVERIIWSGGNNSSLAPIQQNLEQVLAVGNNGGGQSIENVSILANTVYSSGYLEIGNAVSDSSQLHLFYGNGKETGNNFQLAASAGGLQIQYYETSAPPIINALSINKNSNMILCDASNSEPTVQINGTLGLGRVYDTLYNPVSTTGNIDITSYNFTLNYPTQQLPNGYAEQFVSLLEFTFDNNYNSFLLDLNSFSFTYSYNTNVIQSLDVIFFLSSAKNAAGSGDQKSNITIVNPTPTATNNSYSAPVTETLTLRTTAPTNKIYLTVTNNFTLDPDMYIGFTAFTINILGQLSNSTVVTPTVVIPS